MARSPSFSFRGERPRERLRDDERLLLGLRRRRLPARGKHIYEL